MHDVLFMSNPQDTMIADCILKLRVSLSLLLPKFVLVHVDDPACYHLYHSLQGAALVMDKKEKKQSMRLFVIQLVDVSEVADLKVCLVLKIDVGV